MDANLNANGRICPCASKHAQQAVQFPGFHVPHGSMAGSCGHDALPHTRDLALPAPASDLDPSSLLLQVYMARPSQRLDKLATPVLARLSVDVGAARVGVHIRLGDVNLPASAGGPKASINLEDRRYPPGCAGQVRARFWSGLVRCRWAHSTHHVLNWMRAAKRWQ